MSQIPRASIPLTVSLDPPVGATWLAALGDGPEDQLDRFGDVVEWLVRKPESIAYEIVVPVQIYGLTPDGLVIEGPAFGQANIVAAPDDVHDESRLRVMTHIPDVIAYWIVPTGIVGTPDVQHRTVRVGVQP